MEFEIKYSYDNKEPSYPYWARLTNNEHGISKWVCATSWEEVRENALKTAAAITKNFIVEQSIQVPPTEVINA